MGVASDATSSNYLQSTRRFHPATPARFTPQSQSTHTHTLNLYLFGLFSTLAWVFDAQGAHSKDPPLNTVVYRSRASELNYFNTNCHVPYVSYMQITCVTIVFLHVSTYRFWPETYVEWVLLSTSRHI